MAKNTNKIEHVVMVCNGKDCRKKGADKLRCEAKARLRAHGVFGAAMIIKSECTGLCKQGPVMCHQPSNTWITEASKKTVRLELDALLAGIWLTSSLWYFTTFSGAGS